MKQALINYSKNGPCDELYTPPEAVYPLLKYLPRNKVIWECTDHGNSSITTTLKQHGYEVISTHKDTGLDFLKDKPNFHFDIIVTNPPYSLKNQFLKRAYEIGKPFAFLLPITTLEGVERGKMFRNYGLELLVLDRRIQFIKSKKGVWFNTSWFCWNLLPDKLIFEEVSNHGIHLFSS